MSLVVGARVRLGALGATALLVSASMWLFVGRVAATDVGNDAAFRAAWANPAETLISLTGDITLVCTTMVDDVEVSLDSPHRDSAIDIVVDGNGHTLHNPCTFEGLFQNGEGKVTLQDLTFTGNPNSDQGLLTNGAAVITDSNVTGHGDSGIEADGNVSADGSTISNNVEGDGIRSQGDITVTESDVSENGVDEFNCGGGIDAGGDASVDGSTVSGNGDVGILANGDITVSDSVVAGNGIDGECDEDGIRTYSGKASVTRTTVSGNGVETGGSGIFAAEVDAISSTITGNGLNGITARSANVTNSTITAHTGEGGAGIRTTGNIQGTVEFEVNATHATITGNEVNIYNNEGNNTHLFGTALLDAGVANCFGGAADDGHNFVDDDTCDPIAANLDDPKLGALGNNGGPTRTRLPAADSPLKDAIPSGDCELTTEQRGLFARPQGAGCDIGSVEVEVKVTPTPTPTHTTVPTPTPTHTTVPTPTPTHTTVPTASAVPTLPPTSVAAPEDSAPATGSMVLVLAVLAAVGIVSLERRMVIRRR